MNTLGVMDIASACSALPYIGMPLPTPKPSLAVSKPDSSKSGHCSILTAQMGAAGSHVEGI